MKNVHDQETPGVQQDDVTPDDYVPAIPRRRWQPAFQIFRAALHLFPQARRKRAPDYQLSFQPGRKPVPLSEPGRQIVAPAVIPFAHLTAIVITVAVTVSVPVVVIVIAMFVVTVAASLGIRHAARQREQYCRARG